MLMHLIIDAKLFNHIPEKNKLYRIYKSDLFRQIEQIAFLFYVFVFNFMK
ncbi:MAG: hypothetical protein PWQ51_1531 [Methanolobus sp.]|jgi:hypothetical protein|nr:hypothetical protein [Methanolobus sp.]